MNNETVEYDGQEMKLYDAQQKQRAMERGIRKEKRELVACDEACRVNKTPEAVAEYNKHVERLERRYAKLDDFLAQTGLKVRAAAEGVMEYDKTSFPLRVLTGKDAKGLTSALERGIIDSRNFAMGLRTPASHILTPNEINTIKADIKAIGADPNVFRINKGRRTAYNDTLDFIFVKGDVLPDKSSKNPRDLMSSRAVLAHEYYGHRAYRHTKLVKGSWNDEFRASYMAAKNAPNLSDEDRGYLILDAINRAKEAGVNISFNSFMRGVLYGIN